MSLEDTDIVERIGLGRLAPQRGLELLYVRDLTEADLAMLAEARDIVPFNTVNRITARHHGLARMIAAGHKQSVVATTMGYSENYVSRLCNEDPAFKELVTYYMQQREGEWLGVQEKLAGLSVAAMENLTRRVEEDTEALELGLPPKMTAKEVREIMDSAMERSVAPSKGAVRGAAGASSAPVQVNITFPTSEPGHSAPTIDITPTEES